MKDTFKNIIHLLLPEERKHFFLLIFFDVLICILDIAALAALLLIVDFYMHPEKQPAAFLPARFLNHHSVLPVGVFLFLFMLKNLAGYCVSKMQYHFVYRTASRLSQKKILQYLEGNYQNYVTVDTSVHIKKISQQPVEFAHYVLAGLQQIITQSILIGFTIAAIVLFNAKLFFLLLLILLPPLILTALLIKKRTGTTRTAAKNNSEKSLQFLKEALTGFIESKIYHRNEFFADRYVVRQQKLNAYLANLQAVQVIPGRLMEVFAVFGLFVLILLSTLSGTATISVLTIGAFMAAAYKIIPGMVKILNCTGTIRSYEHTINDLSGNNLPERSTGETQDHSISTIAFKNVSFDYHYKKILNSFSCSMRLGDMIGISAVSGKGKTTIINLLLGFENESEGKIAFNEQVTTAMMRQQYWEKTAYVKQQPFLIHDTILLNITLGKALDVERMKLAIKIAGLDELIARYPEGMEKVITENGKNISGGQRQRIVIARALYKNADLVILDEPFNELDNASEIKLLQHFKQLAQDGKIVILVTHNKKSLSFCNTIISLDEN